MSNVVGEVVKDLAVVMQKPWFEKHRPEKFEEVVFESETVRDKIKGFLDQGYKSGNMLSYGPGGTGKTTINKVLAWAIIKSEADLFILGKSVKDVEDLNYSLAANAIDNLRPVWYRSKDASGDDKETWSHIGLIAEEVHAVEPRLVSYRTVEVTTDELGERVETPLEVPEPEGVDYARLSVLLLAEVKSMKNEMSKLKAEIAELKEGQ
jgi:hypothetical protein